MNSKWNKISVPRQAGEALFVSVCLSYDAACANKVSAQHSTAQHSTAAVFADASPCQTSADAEPAFSGGSVKELAFSFFDCTPAPQGPQISVLSDVSVQSDQSCYTFVAEAARDFCGWITVTAFSVLRSVVRAFRRVVCEANALFCRRAFIFRGGLRL